MEENNQEIRAQTKMTTYVPIVFNAILKREKEVIDISSSLNLEKNLDRIKAAGKNDGGKSGQFFFFSSDNRVMLKTITATELKILISKLHKYFMYMQTNKDTMIAKIYGIYTFEVRWDGCQWLGVHREADPLDPDEEPGAVQLSVHRTDLRSEGVILRSRGDKEEREGEPV